VTPRLEATYMNPLGAGISDTFSHRPGSIKNETVPIKNLLPILRRRLENGDML
jgi:hypothetical protein